MHFLVVVLMIQLVSFGVVKTDLYHWVGCWPSSLDHLHIYFLLSKVLFWQFITLLSIPTWKYILIIVSCFPINSMSLLKLKFKYSTVPQSFLLFGTCFISEKEEFKVWLEDFVYILFFIVPFIHDKK